MIQLANIFRAKVIDTSERDTTLAISGDPGKTYAFENGLRKFGIKEIARTCKISLAARATRTGPDDPRGS